MQNGKASISPSDDELKLNRRRFMQFTAATTAASATLVAMAMKTDALAQGQLRTSGLGDGRGDGERYPYSIP